MVVVEQRLVLCLTTIELQVLRGCEGALDG